MTENIQTNQKSKPTYWGWIVFVFIVLGLTLPFHYVPSAMKMFPKDNFTFKHTIITEKDIDDLIEQYNKGNLFEKNSMSNDPFFRTLREQGLIKKKDDN